MSEIVGHVGRRDKIVDLKAKENNRENQNGQRNGSFHPRFLQDFPKNVVGPVFVPKSAQGFDHFCGPTADVSFWAEVLRRARNICRLTR
ncbi:MAG: hypothetical protein QNL02_11845 [Paracoccaceae bacterium]